MGVDFFVDTLILFVDKMGFFCRQLKKGLFLSTIEKKRKKIVLFCRQKEPICRQKELKCRQKAFFPLLDPSLTHSLLCLKLIIYSVYSHYILFQHLKFRTE